MDSARIKGKKCLCLCVSDNYGKASSRLPDLGMTKMVQGVDDAIPNTMLVWIKKQQLLYGTITMAGGC